MPRKSSATNGEVDTSMEVSTSGTVKEKIAPDELIMCRSLTNGGLYITGEKTKIPYSFADYDDEIGIEYQDIVYMIRSHERAVFEPRMIIMDERIVRDYPEVQKVYDSLYATKDLRDIIALPERQMANVVKGLPSGAIDTLKGLVATMIDNHSLDSVSKIRTLDELLGTNHLLIVTKQ